MSILSVENLVKHYGTTEKVVALDGVSFSVEKGDFVAVVGASGCGKSTLLHLIAGIDTPTSGRVLLNGTDVFSFTENQRAILRRREIGIIYQAFNLVPVLNVVDNILLPADLDGKKPDINRLKELLQLLHLEDKERAYPDQLSGGQQQRVAIGRALYSDPSLILADEPTGNLDYNNGLEVVSYLETLNQTYQKTVLIVTHDREIAKRAKRIITMKDGKIIEDERR